MENCGRKYTKKRIYIIEDEHWFKAWWRPSMAWLYLVICAFDFLLFPLITMWWYHHTNTEYVPWKPITTLDSGFFHLSMGAIIGISAYTRGREKMYRRRFENVLFQTDTDEDDSELDPHHIEGDEDTPEPPIHPSHEGE